VEIQPQWVVTPGKQTNILFSQIFYCTNVYSYFKGNNVENENYFESYLLTF